MNEEKDYEANITGESYQQILVYLERNSISSERKSQGETFKFIGGGEIAVQAESGKIKLKGKRLSESICEGIEKIISSNMPLSRGTTGAL